MIKNFLKLAKSHDLKLIEKIKEAQNAYSFRFEKPDVEFEAGQHFIFTLFHKNMDLRGFTRIFSVSSAPSDDYFQFTTRYFGDDSSSFKKALMNMKVGDKISIRGPSPLFDNFKITDYSRPQIYIVGGIGVTPLLSVLKEYDQNVSKEENLQSTIFYLNKNEDFIFDKQISEIIQKYEGLKLVKIISPERLAADKLADEFESLGEDSIVTISGSTGFNKHYLKLAKKQAGIPSSQVRSYKYQGLLGGY